MTYALILLAAVAVIAIPLMAVKEWTPCDPLLPLVPPEPDWIEDIGREGGLHHGRSHSFSDALHELDRKGSRGDFNSHA